MSLSPYIRSWFSRPKKHKWVAGKSSHPSTFNPEVKTGKVGKVVEAPRASTARFRGTRISGLIGLDVPCGHFSMTLKNLRGYQTNDANLCSIFLSDLIFCWWKEIQNYQLGCPLEMYQSWPWVHYHQQSGFGRSENDGFQRHPVLLWC